MMYTTTRGDLAAFHRDYDFIGDSVSKRTQALFRTDEGDVRLDNASFRAWLALLLRGRGYPLPESAPGDIMNMTTTGAVKRMSLRFAPRCLPGCLSDEPALRTDPVPLTTAAFCIFVITLPIIGKEINIMLYAISQIVGILGLVCSLLSFQMKKRKRIMAFQMTASLLFSTQLFLLGAVTGGCLDLISFFRTIVFSQNGKKWASSRWWLYAFIVIMIFAGVFTWKNAWDILPIVGSVLSTIALWMKSEKRIRVISLGVGPCWLIYNLVKGAWSGAINEVLAMTSIVIGLLRYDMRNRSEAP